MREMPPATGARDFGGLVDALPRRVAVPATEREAVELLAGTNLRAAIRGAGHSQSSATLRNEGLIIVTQDLGRSCFVDPVNKLAWAGGGASWRQVVAAATCFGLVPPVLTDHLDTSVGGTLSVGGVGVSSFRHGAQVDQCVELLVGLPTGALVRATPDENSDVFRCVLGGQGQIGIILTAALKLIDAPARLALETRRFNEIDPLLYALQEFAGQPDVHGLEAGTVDQERGGFELVVSRISSQEFPPAGAVDVAHRAFTTRQDAMMAALSNDSLVHPWLDMILPWESAARYVNAARRLVPRIPLLLWPLVRQPDPVNVMVSPGDGTPTVLVTALANCGAEQVEPTLMRLRQLLRIGLTLGGQHYPSGWPPASRDARETRLGRQWHRFEATRATCDPRGTLALEHASGDQDG